MTTTEAQLVGEVCSHLRPSKSETSFYAEGGRGGREERGGEREGREGRGGEGDSISTVHTDGPSQAASPSHSHQLGLICTARSSSRCQG